MKGFLIPSCLLWDNMGQKVVGLWKKKLIGRIEI